MCGGLNSALGIIMLEYEAAFAMRHPYAGRATCERTEHHAVVARYAQRNKFGLEFTRFVMVHFDNLVVRISAKQSKLYHQLAAVAHAKTQSVATAIETFERTTRCFVPAESACPAFCRAKNVAIRESATEYYHIHVVESFTACHKVGHMDVFDVESGKIERIGHFAIAVYALFAYNGCAYSGWSMRRARGFCRNAFGNLGRDTPLQGLRSEIVAARFCAFAGCLQEFESI